MNTLQRDLKHFALRALLRAQGQPINDDTLRSLLRSAFAHVALTEADLARLIRELEASGLITGTNDELFGLTWALSLKGKIKAGELQ